MGWEYFTEDNEGNEGGMLFISFLVKINQSVMCNDEPLAVSEINQQFSLWQASKNTQYSVEGFCLNIQYRTRNFQ